MKLIFSTSLHTFSIFLNFLELFHFPKITRKRSGFPEILEISFNVETLNAYLAFCAQKTGGGGDDVNAHEQWVRVEWCIT